MPAINTYRDDLTGHNHDAEENVNAVLTLHDASETTKRDGKPAEFTLTVTAETFKALTALSEGRDEEFRAYLSSVYRANRTSHPRSTGTSPESTDAATADLNNWLTVNGHEVSKIRAWAKDNGHPDVSDKGRVALEIRMGYAKANGYQPSEETPTAA